MAIDFGAHLYPGGSIPEPLAAGPEAELLGSRLTDADRLLENYDGTGIEQVVLSQPYYMGHGDVGAVAAANDSLLDVVIEHDSLYGLAAVPTAAGGDRAVAEFERCLDCGYHGGAIETRTDGIELTDPALEQVFTAAERDGVPLLVHPTLDASLHPDVLSDEWRLNAIFGREVALAESICKVIHEGVLDRHPDLVLVFHHLGGNIASMLGRIELQLDAGRWPGQERVKPWSAFVDQLRDRVYVDTSGFFGDAEPLRATLAAFPVEHVLFATDYPFEARDRAELASLCDAMETVAGSDADAVGHRNAERLLLGD